MSNYGKCIGKDAIRFERTLPGPIERVWAWLTEEDKRSQWLAAGTIELCKGGRVELFFNNANLTAPNDKPPAKYERYAGETHYVGEVVEVDPPRLISFTWPEESGGVSIASFELEQQGENVRLILTHKKLKEGEDLISAMAGWHTHLDIMAAKLSGVVQPLFWSTHTVLETEYLKRLGKAQ